MNNLKILSVFLFLGLSLGSCFKEDKPIPPYYFNGESFSIQQSIYENQLFYSLETNNVVKPISNGDWDLTFESSPQGWHIRVNSGNLTGIYQTGTFDFNITQFQINSKNWKYDKSSGDPDSTAVGKWVDITKTQYIYSGQVYLIGRYDGISYKPLKKIVFKTVTDSSYLFTYADLNNTDVKDVVIKKDTLCNYSYFSLTSAGQVSAEPPRNNWDLLFTQYTTTLYDKGMPVPYFVRGVLLNPYKVEAAVDSVKKFDQITISDISGFQFNTDLDFIGYNWKSVTINIQTNTAVYAIRPGYVYIIRNVNGFYYKFRFVSFYSSTGKPGYPAFEFIKL